MRGAEDLLELVRSRDLELVVAAVTRPLVWPPPKKDCRVPEAPSLQVVVFDLADPLDPQRLPRKILAGAPAALASGHPGELAASLRPVSPRMVRQGSFSQGCELQDELLARRHRECRRHTHVLQRAAFVVEPEQQRAD